MNLTPSASPGDVRDKAMAENVEWLLNVKYPAAKLVLWAHNYHISNLGRADRPSMGTWLRERHGKDFYRLGFAFDHGTIRAFRPQHGLGIQTIPAAPPSSIEAMLREDGSLVFVNLRDLPPGVLLDWLNGAVWQREIGAVWDPNYADNYYTTVKLAQRFDGLIFVTESHAAQTIANTKGRPLLPVLAAVEQNSAAGREEIARLQRTKPLDRSATQSGSGGAVLGLALRARSLAAGGAVLRGLKRGLLRRWAVLLATICSLRMKLIFIYGPVASGKLTIARELETLTGFAVFHNHLIVDAIAAVFPFGTDRFVRLREDFWLTVMREAAEAGRSIIFTFAPEPSVTAGFPERVQSVVGNTGGEVAFVKLTVTTAEQENRLTAPSRAQFGKLSSAESLRRLRNQFTACEAAMPKPAITIDTEGCRPADAARSIGEILQLPLVSTPPNARGET
jgi:hypothetical protein